MEQESSHVSIINSNKKFLGKLSQLVEISHRVGRKEKKTYRDSRALLETRLGKQKFPAGFQWGVEWGKFIGKTDAFVDQDPGPSEQSVPGKCRKMSLRSVFAFPLIQCLIFDNIIIFELIPTYVISKKCLWRNQSRAEIKGSVHQSKSLCVSRIFQSHSSHVVVVLPKHLDLMGLLQKAGTFQFGQLCWNSTKSLVIRNSDRNYCLQGWQGSG